MRLRSLFNNHPRLLPVAARLAGFMLAALALGASGHAEAAYNPGAIIDDGRFVKPTMSATAIQNWLNTVGSPCLQNYSSPVPLGSNTYGGNVSAAQVIATAASLNGVNPQILLATLQKEEGLVTRSDCPAWRYNSAMGFGCPDSDPGVCAAQYLGFSQQLYKGAQLLRNCFYQDQPGWFCSYVPYTTGTVEYNPNTSCGGTQVYISNRATASLYNYTPYQPDPALLAGTPDGCSSNGNLNFLYYMDYWFPDPTSSGFSLIKGASSPNQYLLENWNGNLTIRLIPDPSVILAWGLDKVTLQTVSDSVITGTKRITPDLSRLSRPSGGLAVYFMDNGQRHAVASSAMLASWNLSSASICDVTAAAGLIPTNGVNLSYALRSTNTSNAAVYMMDGGTLRQYQDPNTLTAWEGDNPTVTPISTGYLGGFSQGANLTNPRITDGGATPYLVVAGNKFALDAAHTSLYPWTAQTVSTATTARLATQSNVPVFLRAAADPAVYLADGGLKHHLAGPDILSSWLGGSQTVATVPSGLVGLLTAGPDVSGYLADVSGQLYTMNGSKRTVPATLDSAYRTGQSVFSASAALMGLFAADAPVQGFVKAATSPDIYLLDSAGQLHYINTPRRWTLWDGNLSHVTSFTSTFTALYPVAGQLGAYVTDGTNNYVVEGGNLLPVAGATIGDWGLSSPVTLPAATLSRFTTGAPLGNTARAGSSYSLIRAGANYITVDPNLAGLWGLGAAPTHTPELLAEFVQPAMLTRFVSSNQAGDSRVFTSDNGVLYHLSPSALLNLGYQAGETRAAINPSAMTGFTSGTWSYDVVQDTAAKNYVIDGGTKRPFPSQTVQDFWTGSGSVTVPVMSNGFLNLLPNGDIIERAIKGSGPNVYAAAAAQKCLITNPATYAQSYAPYAVVSDLLISDLPAGPSI